MVENTNQKQIKNKKKKNTKHNFIKKKPTNEEEAISLFITAYSALTNCNKDLVFDKLLADMDKDRYDKFVTSIQNHYCAVVNETIKSENTAWNNVKNHIYLAFTHLITRNVVTRFARYYAWKRVHLFEKYQGILNKKFG